MKNMKLRLYGFKINRKQMLIAESIFFLVFSLISAYFFFFQYEDELLTKTEREYGLIIFFLFLFFDFWIIIEAQFFFNRFTIAYLQQIEYQRNEIEKQKKEIIDSINYAKRIQTAILPPARVVKESLRDSFILYKPKDVVAGDFYWIEHKDGKVLFAAADCTGHGVPGAMVSMLCYNTLNRAVREYNLTEPGKILDKAREILLQGFEKSEEEIRDGMDISLCVLDGDKLQYAGAYNPLWLIRKKDLSDNSENDNFSLIELKGDKQPISKCENSFSFKTHSIELRKDDTFYIFSDGFADQFGGDEGRKFKNANFKKLLLSIQLETMEKQKQLIDENFEEWKGNLDQIDDVCVIGMRI